MRLRKRQVYCEKCRRSVRMLSSSGMFWGDGVTDSGGAATDGITLMRAECHGQTADIAICYVDVDRLNSEGGVIRVFGEEGVALPFTPTPLPTMHEPEFKDGRMIAGREVPLLGNQKSENQQSLEDVRDRWGMKRIT